jgi:hypothetical protein
MISKPIDAKTKQNLRETNLGLCKEHAKLMHRISFAWMQNIFLQNLCTLDGRL